MSKITLTPTERDEYNLELAYLNIDFNKRYEFDDPFEGFQFNEETIKFDLLDILSNPDNFWLTCNLLLNIDLTPMQMVIIKELYERPFVNLIAARGAAKTFSMALLTILKCVFEPGIKIAIIGMGLRQSKNLYNEIKRIWDNAPLLRQMANRDDGPHPRQDEFSFEFLNSHASCLPLGTSGATIRGKRANLIIIDEYGDVPKAIIDSVVVAFASVSKNPIEKIKLLAKIEYARKNGIWSDELQSLLDNVKGANQIIRAGTAKFHFNHFAVEHQKFKKIILGRGKKELLKDLLDEKTIDDLDWRDYSIIRIPYDLIQRGMMDAKVVAFAKSNLNSAIYNQEFMAVFTKDTDGFFQASLVYDLCTANNTIYYNNEIVSEPFDAMISGDPNKEYILAIDPARTLDNAAFVIIELNKTHNRIVYCWTTNEKAFENLKSETGNSDLGTYYQFCARKVIELTKRFNIILICTDYQGGGAEIMNMLSQDKSVIEDSIPIYPIVDGHPLWNGRELPTDDLHGRHIIEPVQFASATYNSQAHHGLRSDLEKRRLLFPTFDAISMAEVDLAPKKSKMVDDSLGDILDELQSLKYELTIIEYTRTDNSGRERWDTPEIKNDDGTKGRLTNDRVSALVMANYAARRIRDQLPELDFNITYGKRSGPSSTPQSKWRHAPEWFMKKQDSLGVAKIIGM